MRKEFLIFGSPKIEQEEIDEVVDSLKSGWISTGPKVAKFESLFKDYTGSKHALAINSCTAGLHLSMIVAGLKPGDEVITTPMTFGATGNSIIHTGAKPVFADIAQMFYEFIYGAELIAHNASFDIGFLNNEFQLIKSSFGKIEDYCHIIDTLAIARKLHPGQRNSLDALCKRYDITCFKRDLHGALLDAEILAQVYLVITSGQMALMGLDDVETSVTCVDVQSDQPLPVIYASNEELLEHEKFLQMLSKESGREILW